MVETTSKPVVECVWMGRAKMGRWTLGAGASFEGLYGLWGGSKPEDQLLVGSIVAGVDRLRRPKWVSSLPGTPPIIKRVVGFGGGDGTCFLVGSSDDSRRQRAKSESEARGAKQSGGDKR